MLKYNNGSGSQKCSLEIKWMDRNNALDYLCITIVERMFRLFIFFLNIILQRYKINFKLLQNDLK